MVDKTIASAIKLTPGRSYKMSLNNSTFLSQKIRILRF